ncbi:CCA tRNA nucleotidyltransferase [uncultured Limosilactobacillus sp.]|uniref:CCA tRNA nucleotidyltransferase n=1 Tax=uncultured Limosilactobacillus sp. TaxID=2837629 RepID=UPI0025EF70D5|nr:CCA tRNA nucleotidyltransferase [uncultured Limosilactobacillus sp.]
MVIKQLPAIFEPARPVLQRIEDAGYQAYFVGGCVRDTILGDHIHDIDIATSAYPSEIKSLFKKTVDTGIQHGTVMVLDHDTGYEITTFRTESGYQDFRRPDNVTFVRSLADDLKRRDFTINALALRENGEVIDLFNGLTDLKKHLIRAVGKADQRFHEDALRMMRAVRFASKLNFEIEAATLHGIADNAQLLSKIAVERIQVEMEKLLLGQNPPVGLAAMVQTGLYRYCPSLSSAKAALTQLALMNNWQLSNATQAWGTLAVALGLDSHSSRAFLKKWKLSNQLIENVQTSLPAVFAIKARSVSADILYHCGREGLVNANQIAAVFGWALPMTDLLARYQQLPIKNIKELAITGGGLIRKGLMTPGPELGKMLKWVEKAVVNQEVDNRPEEIIMAIRQRKEEL